MAAQLVAQGHQVRASTRSITRFPEIETIGALPYEFDIDEMSGDIQTFLNSKLLIVNITSKNIEGFTRLVAEIENSPIEYVIFVSSTSVYRNTNDIVNEDDGDENIDSPLFKIENLFRGDASFKTTVVRFAGLIGYSRHPGRFFGEREIPQPEAPVNLIHRDDCLAIITAIMEQNLWGQVLNGCTDSHPSKRDFYSYARRAMGREPPLCSEMSEASFKIIGNEKVKRLLSYQFQHPDLMKLVFE